MTLTHQLRRTVTLVGMALSGWLAASADDSISYVPKLHGVVRARWEMETEDHYSHFQVRNARLNVSGYAAPVLSYYINADFCDRGKMQLLDAYADLFPVKGLDIRAGQFRMPFGIESFMGPGGYYFNNRSYIGKQVNNYRAVGVAVEYTLPKIPLTFETGVFNPTVIDDHTTWIKKYAYAGRVMYRPGDWLFAGGFESIIPGTVRVNLVSATVGWGRDRFYTEAEYMVRWYTHKSHKTTYAYNAYATYDIPLRKFFFDVWSWQLRFDGMTDLASGSEFDPDIMGHLATTAVGRRRLTVGTTLDYKLKKVRIALRFNYEKVWYDKDFFAPRGEGDVLSAEMIVKF